VCKEYRLWTGFWGFLRPRRREVLSGVELHLAAGEGVGLCGENGAGKTTLLKVLCGVLLPTGGRILVDGMPLSGDGALLRGRVAMAVAESRSFYWRLTCRRNLEFFAALQGHFGRERAREVDCAAEAFAVTPFLDERFYTLSSGQMQRVALARLLLSGAGIWMLDEPGRDLDGESKGRLHEEIVRLRRGGGAVLVASHDEDELARTCDRTVTLRQGRIVRTGAEGEPEAGGDGGRHD
ncbi:MAG: ABC transporter ATP-binding protein, partial [Deltaproteobacteria bacterium]|nr:ABC transporter ATP-binding protein [Deltaproteobacteria bacterium]